MSHRNDFAKKGVRGTGRRKIRQPGTDGSRSVYGRGNHRTTSGSNSSDESTNHGRMRENVGFAGQAAHRGPDILTKGKVSGRQAVCALIPVIWRLHLARQAVKTNPRETRRVSRRVPGGPDSATLCFVASLRGVMARKDTMPQSKRMGGIGRAGQGRALVTDSGRSRQPLRRYGCTGGHGSPRDGSRSCLRSPESCRFPLQTSE